MNKIIILLLTLLPVVGYGQSNFTQEFGKVTQDEMSMKEYALDKDAEAVVIYDFGDYYFQGEERRGFLLKMTKTIKIKILKQAGIKYANFEIPYYTGDREWETIEEIKATTYNWDNNQLTKTELNSKNIFEEKINNNVRVKKIALSDVREGSVIELRYKIVTPYYFNMRKWNFQQKIPVVHSRLNYRAVPYYEYTYILKGTNKLDEFTSKAKTDDIRFGNLLYKEMEYNFGMKNIPAFRDEEFITSEEDYLIALNFQMSKIYFPQGGSQQIISTWTDMCDDFLKDDDFGKYIKNSEKEAKKILPELRLENESQLKQAQIITKYVKSMYNWNENYGKYTSDKVSNFLKTKTGNVADINLFLIGLLQAAQIDVSPVVLSTRKNGAISQGHPFRQFFNYVIAKVNIDNKAYYIDATEPLLYFDDLPERCTNVRGLVVKPKTEEWTVIIPKSTSLYQKEFEIKVHPEKRILDVKAQYATTGNNAYNLRSIYSGKEDNLKKHLKDRNNIQINDSIKVSNNEQLNKPFLFSFEFDASLEQASDKLFINPFCNLAIGDNPFKQNSRTLLVDLVYIRSEIYKSNIEIPTGYKVEYIPSTSLIDNDLIKMSYNVNQSEGKIIVLASYNLKKAVYAPEEYTNLKMAFANMIKQFSEMIVLVKEQ